MRKIVCLSYISLLLLNVLYASKCDWFLSAFTSCFQNSSNDSNSVSNLHCSEEKLIESTDGLSNELKEHH